MQATYNDTAWDIMSGTPVESKVIQEVVISAKGMTKIEFDELVCLFGTGLELQGWKKTFSGMNAKDDLECRFKLIEKI